MDVHLACENWHNFCCTRAQISLPVEPRQAIVQDWRKQTKVRPVHLPLYFFCYNSSTVCHHSSSFTVTAYCFDSSRTMAAFNRLRLVFRHFEDLFAVIFQRRGPPGTLICTDCVLLCNKFELFPTLRQRSNNITQLLRNLTYNYRILTIET